MDKYIGESARLIREMFNYARDHQPCIIFMDEIDAIGGRRFSEGTSADREIQRYAYLYNALRISNKLPQYIDGVAESNGRIRRARPGQNDHGDQPTGHPRPRAPSTRPPRQKD